MDFVKEFQRRARKINNGETVKESPKPSLRRVELYSLIKIQDGTRTRVGFGLTEAEAESLAKVLTKKMRKLNEVDEGGSPLFEITLSEIAKEVQP